MYYIRTEFRPINTRLIEVYMKFSFIFFFILTIFFCLSLCKRLQKLYSIILQSIFFSSFVF